MFQDCQIFRKGLGVALVALTPWMDIFISF